MRVIATQLDKAEKQRRTLEEKGLGCGQPFTRAQCSNARTVHRSLAAHDIAVRSLQAIVDMPASFSSRSERPLHRDVGIVFLGTCHSC
jgi:hypothetical protein